MSNHYIRSAGRMPNRARARTRIYLPITARAAGRLGDEDREGGR